MRGKHCLLRRGYTENGMGTSTHNKVEMLHGEFIYVEKVGDQTEATMMDLYMRVKKLAAELRKQGKPVLILSNAERQGATDEAGQKAAVLIGKELDFDKSATYTSSEYLHNLRDVMAKAIELDQKVANFDTRAEAAAWLMV
jgi:hypothetical protein